MKIDSRRGFLKGSSIALGTVAAGSVAAVSATAGRHDGQTGMDPLVAGFGWDISNINNNGADVYFKVENAMTLNSVNIDVAFVPLSLSSTGFAEVLCTGGISRGAVPMFDNTGGHAYPVGKNSTNFGSATVYNPNGLNVTPVTNLGQDGFYTVILKTWVPSGGSAAATSRQLLANPSLSLNVGDYFFFHMDHLGVPGDAEMLVTLQYSLV